MSLLLSGSDGLSDVDGTAATPAIRGTDANTGISFGTDTVTISTGGVARVTTDASGNVGIGTSSPSAALHVKRTSGSSAIYADYNGTNVGRMEAASNGNLYIGLTTGSGTISIGNTAYTDAVLLDSSGNLLVGTTSLWAGSGKFTLQQIGVQWARATNHTNAGTQYFDSFGYNGLGVGGITGNNTSTIYGTTSDYRLKENVAPMTGALEKVAALKPCTYTWKVDGSAGQGFIAHELQAVVPDCVTGEKDAVETVDDLDAEGRKIGTKEVPRYQGVDTSFLVATLVAAIQELKSEFDAYKATHP
jgi:hypothetical protein